MTKPKSAKTAKTAKKPERTISAIKRQARTFGKTFERAIVHEMKEAFAGYSFADMIRRSDQSHRAWLPDVTGVPGLWIECQVAARTSPYGKLAQAIRDVQQFKGKEYAIPIAITRQKGSPTISATLCLSDLAFITNAMNGVFETLENLEKDRSGLGLTPVTLLFDLFNELICASKLLELDLFTGRAIDTEVLRASLQGELPQTINAIAKDIATMTNTLVDISRSTTPSQAVVQGPKPAPRPAPKPAPKPAPRPAKAPKPADPDWEEAPL